jgi:hypothetical protein
VGGNEACPINVVESLGTGITPPDFKDGDFVSLNDKKYVFKRNTDPKERSVVDLLVSSGDAPCYDPNIEPPLAESFKSYPYNRVPYESCGDFKQMAKNYKKLDTITEEKLFSINKIEEKIEPLPFQRSYFFPKDKFNLLVGKRIEVANDKSCKFLDTPEAEEVHGYAESTQNIMHGFAIAILVLSCLIILFALLFFFFQK